MTGKRWETGDRPFDFAQGKLRTEDGPFDFAQGKLRTGEEI
jgi:hypothetical protein